MTAARACEVASRELRRAQPGWTVDAAPLSDGGDGFCEILARAAGVELTPCRVTGPRGGTHEVAIAIVPWSRVPEGARALLARHASYAPSDAGSIGVVEMAAASGLALLPPELRDPWHASSYGTGQMIRVVAEMGAKAIVLGIGGSATSDLGLGALGALGLEFRAENGEQFRPATPFNWAKITRIEGEIYQLIPPMWIACDVDNPLVGPRGAAAIYGPQKGLTAGDVPRLDAATAKMAAQLCVHTGRPNSLAEIPGAGAAGGIAFGLMAAARATIVPGASLVSAWLRLEDRIAAADVVITGEGRFDASSLSGKIPGTIAIRAHALGKQVHIFAGSADASVAPEGIKVHSISPADLPLETALREGPDRLASSARAAFAQAR